MMLQMLSYKLYSPRPVRALTLLIRSGCLLLGLSVPHAASSADAVQVGSRPLHLVDALQPGALKEQLAGCAANDSSTSELSIAHRGAPLQYPEHSKEGYNAAARMGAGIIECDVTFTSDKALVCRHSQCDLQTTTNILQTPLAEKCSSPPDMGSSTPFKNVKCCTSDITLGEYKSLSAKMDAGNSDASTLQEYMNATAPYRTDLYSPGTLLTHAESIELFKSLGVKMIPELKAPAVDMPYQGDYSQQDYANALVEEYIAAGVAPENVFLQSFNLDDVLHWIKTYPAFGQQAAYLDGRYNDKSFNPQKPKTWKPSMQSLADQGVKILAPPMWMLVTLEGGELVPSAYAVAAKKAGLDIVPWTLERSGPLANGGGWYYQSVKSAIGNDSDMYRVLDVLYKDVGIRGIFSDWPATVTYYANCVGAE